MWHAQPFHHHIFTVLSYDAARNVQVSMDGGQYASLDPKAAGKWGPRADGSCMTIRKIARQPKGLGTSTVKFPPDGNDRELVWWCDVTRLEFDKQVILPKRNAGPDFPDWVPSDPDGHLLK